MIISKLPKSLNYTLILEQMCLHSYKMVENIKTGQKENLAPYFCYKE